MNMINTRLSIIAVALIVGFTTGWLVHGWHYDSQYKSAYRNLLKSLTVQEKQAKSFNEHYNQALSKYQNQNDQENQEIENEINNDSTYSSCVIPANGVQFLNAAIQSANQAEPT